MSFIQSLILGIIQGLTEFLPVSSSAHLVLVPYILNWQIPQNQVFPFDVLVQIGTLLAVIIYFRKDLWSIIREFVQAILNRKPFGTAEARMGWYLILATIPAGLAGIFLKDRVEAAFNNARTTAIFLFVTALFLLASEFFSRRNRKLEQMNWLDALIAGIFQALSIFPGVSRSGSSITGGMLRHLERRAAARFAFLMSIPVMLAAGIFSIPDLLEVPDLGGFLPILIVGFLAAAIVGYLSIHWLLSFLNKRSLVYFAAYCILLASAVLIIASVRPTSNGVAQETITEQTQVEENTVANTMESTLAQPFVDTTDHIIQLNTSAATDWLLPIASDCINTVPGLALVTNPTSPSIEDEIVTNVTFHWGEPATPTESAVILAQDTFAIIVNSDNPLEKLPVARFHTVLDGTITTWADLLADCPNCYSEPPSAEVLDLPIELYFYTDESDVQAALNTYFTPAARVANTAVIVPSTMAMQQAVHVDPAALGFIPALALGETDNLAVNLTESGETYPVKIPLLAITSNTAPASVSHWLVCVQDRISP